MSFSLILTATIFCISLVLTMVGLGGGLVFSPLFVILGMAQSQAASASLFLNLVAAASAAWAYSRKRMVDFSVSIPLIVASGLAAPAGSCLNLRMDTQPFLIVMAIVLALAGARMLVSPPRQTESATDLSRSRKIAGGLAIGACIGLMSGLLGIGGGVFVVPLLIYALKTPTKIAAASSTFIVCFSSLTGFLGYAAMASVDWQFILPAALAALAGGQLGARIMSGHVKANSIRVLFSLVLFAMCLKLLHRFFFG
jgi:uncharacterized membrane protein YfcA